MPGAQGWNSLEQARAKSEQHRENSARLARAYGHFTTTGYGEKILETWFSFGCTFIDMPAVTHTWSLDEDDELVATRVPRVSAGVYKWKRTPEGFYTGAWVCFVVETQSPYVYTSESEPYYTLHQHMVFEGHALKDLPEYLMDY